MGSRLDSIRAALTHYKGASFKSKLRDPLLRGGGSAFVVNGAGAVLAFVSHVVLARFMGAEEYGVYAYVMSWASVTVILCTFGFDSCCVRFLPGYVAGNEKRKLAGLIRVSNRFVLASSLAAIVILLTWLSLSDSPHASGMYGSAFAALSLIIPVWALSNLRQAALRAFKQILASRIPDAVIRPAILLLLITLAHQALNPLNALVYHAIAIFCAFLVGAVLLTRSLSQHQEFPPEYCGREWVSTACMLLLISGLHVLINEIDTLLLGYLGQPRQVGMYSSCVRVASIILFAQQAMGTIVAPLISELHARGDMVQLQRLVSRSVFWATALSLPLFIVIALFGHSILGVFGPEFPEAHAALVALVFGQLTNVSLGPVGFVLSMTGHHRESLRILALSLGLHILLVVLGFYSLGLLGVAIATAVSVSFRNVAMWYRIRTTLGIDASILSVRRRRSL